MVNYNVSVLTKIRKCRLKKNYLIIRLVFYNALEFCNNSQNTLAPFKIPIIFLLRICHSGYVFMLNSTWIVVGDLVILMVNTIIPKAPVFYNSDCCEQGRLHGDRVKTAV